MATRWPTSTAACIYESITNRARVVMKISRFTQWVVILNCIVPAMLLAWDAFQGDLGANPVNFAIRTSNGLHNLINVKHARFVDHSVHGYLPRLGNKVPGCGRDLFLVGRELVEVV